MNAPHLIWIVPLSMFAGAFCMALAAVGTVNEVRGQLEAYEDTGLSPEEIMELIKATDASTT